MILIKKKYIKIILLLLFNQYAHSIVILIHGTFASEAEWCKPGGNFYTILKNEANRINEKLISFTWSGALSNQARIEAAEDLAQVILSYAMEKKIILIGHSHGGNVINLTSKLLDPIEEPPTFAHFPDVTAFIQAYRNINKQKRGFHKEYCIDQVYLLGTPIDLENYPPNMKVIKHLCNIYSIGDKVQSLLGMYKQIVTRIDRAVNIQITIRDKDIINDNPSHNQMHHVCLAQWLLSIPNELKSANIGGFDHFTWTQDGKIHFDHKQKPVYTVFNKILYNNPELEIYSWR